MYLTSMKYTSKRINECVCMAELIELVVAYWLNTDWIDWINWTNYILIKLTELIEFTSFI